MFYKVKVSFGTISQEFFFERFETGYAIASRRAAELTEAKPNVSIISDKEEKDFNKGAYTRTITLLDTETQEKGTINLTNEYFMDHLVEQFPEQYPDYKPIKK